MSAVPLLWAPADAVAAGLNVAVAVGASFAAGYWAHRLPAPRLRRDGPVLRLRRFEADGRFYERRVAIRRWKRHLPEAGALFRGGRSKRRLGGADAASLAAFAVETRRAERAHWVAMLLVIGLPLLWNRGLGVALMVLYGIAANAPCIAVQRYNRARLERVLGRSSGVAARDPRSSTSRSEDG